MTLSGNALYAILFVTKQQSSKMAAAAAERRGNIFKIVENKRREQLCCLQIKFNECLKIFSNEAKV